MSTKSSLDYNNPDLGLARVLQGGSQHDQVDVPGFHFYLEACDDTAAYLELNSRAGHGLAFAAEPDRVVVRIPEVVLGRVCAAWQAYRAKEQA